MTDINSLYRNRIGFPANIPITLENLASLMEKTALAIPFENLCIIANHVSAISKATLAEKILVRNEGGLCYELNSLLYYFLEENGFNVRLIRGRTFNSEKQTWSPAGRTHVVILLTDEERIYLVDTGYGATLPLLPLSLTGEVATSNNGDFRVAQVKTENGDYLFEMKLKHKGPDWKIGYAFDTRHTVKDELEINEVQRIIYLSENSPFNKGSLVTKNTDKGTITLTDTSFTQWNDGQLTKEDITHQQFKEYALQHFNLQC